MSTAATETRARASAMPPDERRAAIVSATVPLLLEHGSAVSTRQIAEAAGIAEGTIFRVFPDKQAVIAASVEAKRYGIRTGTPVWEAKRLCRELIVTPARHKRYVEFHDAIVAEIWRHIPVTRVCSIDEVACRLLDNENARARPRLLHHELSVACRSAGGRDRPVATISSHPCLDLVTFQASFIIDMTRRMFIVGAFVAITGLSAGAYYVRRPDEVPRIGTGVVSRGPIIASISASGTVEPVTTVQVGTQISGTVQALYADFNSVVKKGQVVARLDPSLVKAEIERARAWGAELRTLATQSTNVASRR